VISGSRCPGSLFDFWDGQSVQWRNWYKKQGKDLLRSLLKDVGNGGSYHKTGDKDSVDESKNLKIGKADLCTKVLV